MTIVSSLFSDSEESSLSNRAEEHRMVRLCVINSLNKGPYTFVRDGSKNESLTFIRENPPNSPYSGKLSQKPLATLKESILGGEDQTREHYFKNTFPGSAKES